VALKHKLREDFRELRIIKESDIETCAYYHLRIFLRKDPRWNILARYFAKNTGHYIDLVIFRNSNPRLLSRLNGIGKTFLAKTEGVCAAVQSH